MIPYKNRFIESIAKAITPKVVNDVFLRNGGIAISYNEILASANVRFEVFTKQIRQTLLNETVTSPPLITEQFFGDLLSDIQIYANALLNLNILKDYTFNTLKYTKITQRFLYSNILTNNIINELSNYSCRHIDVTSDLEESLSNTFTIGNYITLPFCIENVRCYNGPLMVTSLQSDEIKFENFSENTSLPLKYPILMRYLSSTGSNSNEITILCSMTNFTPNLVYINTYGSIESIRLECVLNNKIVYSSINNSDEALFSFDPIKINGIRIVITLSNYNINKQVSFEISELVIMSNVNFSTSAKFESVPVEVRDFFDINKIQINARNYSTNKSEGFSKFVSLSLNSAYKNFFQIDDISGTFIPSQRYTHTGIKNLDGAAENYQISAISAGTKKVINSNYFKFIPEASFNYKQAKILIGTNDAYGTTLDPEQDNGRFLENWTKIDNFYRTMILNNEEGVSIDIGTNQVKLNNVVTTGMLNIPIGINMIDVHESIFDPTLGSIASSASTNLLVTDEYIYGDKLYPYNFVYKLAGLPAYKNGTLDTYSESQVVTGTSVIHLDTPVLPLTISVAGLNGNYSLHFGNIPVLPGTFTIEPNKGILRIHALPDILNDEVDTVTIEYVKASNTIRPCGILFNRAATYIDYKSVYNMMTILSMTDNTFFTYFKDGTTPTVLIPNINSDLQYLKPYHNKIMYNISDSRLWASIRFELYTNNTNISPAIKNIFIQGYK